MYNVYNPQPLDPSIGKLRFKSLTWGFYETGKAWADYKDLKSHLCTSEELGLSGTNH